MFFCGCSSGNYGISTYVMMKNFKIHKNIANSCAITVLLSNQLLRTPCSGLLM